MKATPFKVVNIINRKGYLFRGNEQGLIGTNIDADHGRIWVGVYKDEYGQPCSSYFAWRVVVIDTGYELPYQYETKKDAVESLDDNWHLIVSGYQKGIK